MFGVEITDRCKTSIFEDRDSSVTSKIFLYFLSLEVIEVINDKTNFPLKHCLCQSNNRYAAKSL